MNTTKTLPPYAPKTPLKGGPASSNRENVRNYGPAPEGYRWREVGEKVADGDILADGWSSAREWRAIGGGFILCSSHWPIATPVKSHGKRDPSTGRFVSAKPAKVELGKKFLAHNSKSFASIEYCKGSISYIERVLGDDKDKNALWGVFDWEHTVQGFSYWSSRRAGTPLSPSDLDYLRAAKEFFEKRVAELTPKPPVDIGSRLKACLSRECLDTLNWRIKHIEGVFSGVKEKLPSVPPTVAELQAKIASLESENATLRRKIAGAKVTFPE